MLPLRPASMAKSFTADPKHRCHHQSSPSPVAGGWGWHGMQCGGRGDEVGQVTKDKVNSSGSVYVLLRM